MTPLRQNLQARIDLQDLSDELMQHSEVVAHRFVAAVRAGFEAIQAHPEMAPRLRTRKRQLLNCRVWQVKGFRKYLIHLSVQGRADRGCQNPAWNAGY